MTTTPLLSTNKLTLEVGGKTVCRDLQLEIHPGQCWGILGQNGVGKTTLLHALAGLNPGTQEKILLHGNALSNLPRKELAKQIGVLFQENANTLPATVLETVLLGRHPYADNWRWENEQDVNLARSMLEKLELGGFESRMSDTLSGGEKQRLALATLLTQTPNLYLLDEPTNHLDLKHQSILLKLFSRIASQDNHAVVMIMHDINLASRYCDHLLLIHPDGEIQSGKCTEILNLPAVEKLYQHPFSTTQGSDGLYFFPQ